MPHTTPTWTLVQLNALDEEAFVAALGDIFEHAPWVAAQAHARRPFTALRQLHAAMLGAVHASPVQRQVDFLCGHPELSAEAVRSGGLTRASDDEQRSAGLQSLSARDEAWLAEHNQRYRARHGFPFIACVRHYTQAGLFAELQSRCERDTEQERREALRQIGFITWTRLSARVTPAARPAENTAPARAAA